MIRRPSRQVRETIHLAVIVLWLGPGAVLSYIWMNSVPWLVFMSWFACIYAGVSAWAAETPVEHE